MTHTTRSYKYKTLSIFIALAGVFMFPLKAYSTFISPARIIISSNDVAGEMTILNKSDETKVYSFKWQDRAMHENAKIVTDESKLKDITRYRPASQFLVYSPRQVILGPGETQRVRFFVKRGKMTDGEYRSHILISGKPVKEKEQIKPYEGLSGTIGVVPQAGIPIMVRHGKTNVEIEPELFEIIKVDGKDYLHAKFINKSTRTLYAKPTLICQRAGADEPERIDVMAIRMYYEAIYFDQKLRVRATNPNLEGCQSLRVEFTDKLDFEYKHKPFYSQTLR